MPSKNTNAITDSPTNQKKKKKKQKKDDDEDGNPNKTLKEHFEYLEPRRRTLTSFHLKVFVSHPSIRMRTPISSTGYALLTR